MAPRRYPPDLVRAAVMLLAAAAAVAAAAVVAASAPTPRASQPLRTAVVEASFAGPDAALLFRRARASGATRVRLSFSWSAIAPAGSEPPAFDASDPSAAGYRWAGADRMVQLAVAHGGEPIANVVDAPTWAQQSGPRPNGGALRPSPAELRKFAQAVALRYSGRFEGLPRVRYWQVWNEPNLTHFLNPQYAGSRLVSPAWYRAMVNAFSDGVKSVHRDNVVVAGGLAPFECHGRGGERACGSAPFRFMRDFFCLSRALRPTCSASVRVDAWSHHPYTAGGPTRQAFRRDDASLGDLPEMKRVLDAAYRHRRIVAPRRPEFWVTEFSWDTKPPDTGGVPPALHARWVSEALYRMWSAGVSLVTWWTIRDHPYPQSAFQSGLWYRGQTIERDRPKPALQAFRFPFVALREGRGVRVWGRTPSSGAGSVTIQRSSSAGWRRVAVLRANRAGIFSARLAAPARGSMRAVAGPGAANLSRPFGLRRPRDIRVQPFGDFPVDVDR